MNLKKIGILGSGEVAQSLAEGFLKHGFQVTLGTRDVKKLADFKNKHAAVKVGSFEDAATFGELIILAVKGTGAEPLRWASSCPTVVAGSICLSSWHRDPVRYSPSRFVPGVAL